MNKFNSIDKSIISLEKFISLTEKEKSDLEPMIKEKINEGDSYYYDFIPHFSSFEVGYLLSAGHCKKLEKNNLLNLFKNIYLKKPSPSLLDYIVRYAKTDEYALECVREISEKRPDIYELPLIIKDIEQNGFQIKEEKKHPSSIIYFKESNGLIIKIIPKLFTAYRFNKDTKEWQNDSVLFTMYEHGNLSGEIIEMDDNYPIGEPFKFGRSL